MESIFSFLFKYRPVLYQEGDFAFTASWPVATALLVAAAVAAVALVTYVRPRAKAGRRDRIVMGALRLATLAVLLFCLFRPTLVLTSVVPQRNFVGVLVDDSRSMTLEGEDGEPRSEWVRRELGVEDGALREALLERFAVRFFRFDSDASRISSVAEMGWDGTRTDLATALDRAREELSSVPLSGLVVVSDGADNAGRPLAEALVPLQAASVPVYTVGLGEERLSPDLQVARVEAPRQVLQGTALIVDVLVSHRGYGGETVTVVAEDDARILAEEEIELGPDGELTVARIPLVLEDAGPRRVRFHVPPREDERVERNNGRSVLVEVVEDEETVLYFEGELRWEVAFTRRAVAEDPNLRLLILNLMAKNKFARFEVEDEGGEELAGGFPQTREELFRYEGLILGSVEASFFTHDQLQMIADFVSRRGGGLLALGGRNALAEGGYVGTPVAEALPILLEEPAPDPRAAYTPLRLRPTVAGRGHAATQIRPGAATSDSVWEELPELSTLNRVVRLKPGATALLEGVTPSGEERVGLAYQRYGRGKALAFPVQDVWTWQMHYDVSLEDQSHENLWKQLLRWLVDGVPERVEVRPDRERAEPGETVRLVAEVNDSSYLEVNDARVTATVTAPDGTSEEVELEWTVERDGEYAGTFRPDQEGEYQIVVNAERDEGPLGSDATWVEAGPSDAEYFDAAQRRPVLERLAEETGGRYYDAGNTSALPEDIQYTGSGVTLTEERDLWDMPFLFLLLVALVGAEWGFRKKRGLV